MQIADNSRIMLEKKKRTIGLSTSIGLLPLAFNKVLEESKPRRMIGIDIGSINNIFSIESTSSIKDYAPCIELTTSKRT